MRFIVDESTGAAVVDYLRTVGHDVVAVAEAMPQANDIDVLARAAAEDRILITNDKDFGELVFRRRQPHRGVLLLRLRSENPSKRVRVVKAILDQHADRLAGSFTIATEAGVRIQPAG